MAVAPSAGSGGHLDRLRKQTGLQPHSLEGLVRSSVLATNLAIPAYRVVERRRGLTHHRAIRRSRQHLWSSARFIREALVRRAAIGLRHLHSRVRIGRSSGGSAARGGHTRTGRGTTGLTTAGQSTVGTHGGTGHRHQREQNGLCHDTFLLNLGRGHELHQETWTPSPELDGLKMVGLRRTRPARPAYKRTRSRRLGQTPTSLHRSHEGRSCEVPPQSRRATRTND